MKEHGKRLVLDTSGAALRQAGRGVYLLMLAGIVLGLTRGLPIREAVQFGIAAGAAALLRSGTQLCRREDVERLFQAATAGRPPSR